MVCSSSSLAAPPDLYPLSLHDALPIYPVEGAAKFVPSDALGLVDGKPVHPIESAGIMAVKPLRSEEHTSELQSPCNLVCRLLLEKKKETDGRSRGDATRCA